MISGVQSRLRQLDIYRKLPSDLTEPTKAGALISILSILVMLFLFITELREFEEITIINEMFVDTNKGGEQIRINLDIEFSLLPCDLLSLDVQDAMGTHFLNVEGELIKKRIINGQVISEEVHTNHQDHEHKPPFDFQRVSQALRTQEGCQIVGHIFVNKVPGNFHISCHAFGQILHQVLHQNNLFTVNLSHKINHLSFGEFDELGLIKQKFHMDHKGLNPLDGLTQKNQLQGQIAEVYQYFVAIVPTTFIDLTQKEYDVYQFIANNHSFQSDHFPAVYFRFELQPVTVKYTQQKESFMHFLVEICGIIGGVFIIARLIDSFVHKSVVNVLRKFEMNKFY